MHKLYLCQTCQRDRPPRPGAESRGARLTRALLELWPSAAIPDTLILRVACLNGCLNPCNIALRAPRKISLRLSRLDAEDAADVLTLLRAYVEDDTGDVAPSRWPRGLREHLSARVPPPHSLGSRPEAGG